MTILDGGTNSKAYSLYEETVITGEISSISMTPEDELVQYMEKLGVIAFLSMDSRVLSGLYGNGWANS